MGNRVRLFFSYKSQCEAELDFFFLLLTPKIELDFFFLPSQLSHCCNLIRTTVTLTEKCWTAPCLSRKRVPYARHVFVCPFDERPRLSSRVAIFKKFQIQTKPYHWTCKVLYLDLSSGGYGRKGLAIFQISFGERLGRSSCRISTVLHVLSKNLVPTRSECKTPK